MIEIMPVSPLYTIKPVEKIVREDKNQQQSKNTDSGKKKQDKQADDSTETPLQHIDEIV